MTTDSPARPSDEVTAKVVAEWMGWEKAYWFYSARYEVDGWSCHPDPCPYDDESWCFDPRDDTNSALRLLHWWADRMEDIWGHGVYIEREEDHWIIREHAGIYPMRTLPISGEPFCFAVVTLAAGVMGVGDG